MVQRHRYAGCGCLAGAGLPRRNCPHSFPYWYGGSRGGGGGGGGAPAPRPSLCNLPGCDVSGARRLGSSAALRYASRLSRSLQSLTHSSSNSLEAFWLFAMLPRAAIGAPASASANVADPPSNSPPSPPPFMVTPSVITPPMTARRAPLSWQRPQASDVVLLARSISSGLIKMASSVANICIASPPTDGHGHFVPWPAEKAAPLKALKPDPCPVELLLLGGTVLLMVSVSVIRQLLVPVLSRVLVARGWGLGLPPALPRRDFCLPPMATGRKAETPAWDVIFAVNGGCTASTGPSPWHHHRRWPGVSQARKADLLEALA